MIVSALRILREASACFFEQLRSHAQISLSRLDVYMAQVGRQLRKQALNVLAIAIPCKNTMYGCGMAQIMQARWMQFPFGAFNMSCAAQALKQSDDLGIRPPLACV
jgi:hypothetical protein